MTVKMNTELEYLLGFLEDEFRNTRDVRIRLSPAIGTVRSIDLPQDYDPEANDLHLQRGVFVTTKKREFYFPVQWVSQKNFEEIRKLAVKIHDHLEYLA